MSDSLGTSWQVVSSSTELNLPRVVSSGGTDVDEARRRARRFESDEYLNLEQFAQNVESYYADIDPDSDRLLQKLSELLRSSHHTEPRYAPNKEVYPVVDRQPDGTLRSIYSASGHSFSFEELLQADLEVELARQEKVQELVAENLFDADELEAIESLNPFNCEHVVPQSWFSKKEPMRGDLHHLFTCESDPVTDWERHRNECIFAVQGNRNPFVDHPEWAGLITFASALARGRGQFGGVEGATSSNALRN